MCRKTFAKRPSRRRRRGGRSVRVFPRRSVRGRQTERALEPQQTGLRVHLDPELADLLARLAQAGLRGERNGFETTSEKRNHFFSTARREPARSQMCFERRRNVRVFLSSRTRSSRRSRAASACFSLCIATTIPACASAFAATVARRRASARSCRSCGYERRVRSGPVGSWRGSSPRASGGNETGRTFALCCASSWFTITRRLNVVCCGAGCVAEGGSGARGRACHGVSRMEHVLRSFRDARRRLREAEGDRKTAQRNELRTM